MAFFLGNDDAGFALLNRMTLWYQVGMACAYLDGKPHGQGGSELGGSLTRLGQVSQRTVLDLAPPPHRAPKEKPPSTKRRLLWLASSIIVRNKTRRKGPGRHCSWLTFIWNRRLARHHRRRFHARQSETRGRAARIFRGGRAAGRDPQPWVRSSSAMIAARDAHAYAELAAQVAAGEGFNVPAHRGLLPHAHCAGLWPYNDDAVGGITLSSHNRRVGREAAWRRRREPAPSSPTASKPCCRPSRRTLFGPFQTADLMTDYLAALRELVDVEAIHGANLSARCAIRFTAPAATHLAGLLRDMGVEVGNPQHGGPHLPGCIPEPIQPWVDEGLAKVGELATMPCSSTMATPTALPLATSRAAIRGTASSRCSQSTWSTAARRAAWCLCDGVGHVSTACKAEAGVELVSTPVGFGWIYGEDGKRAASDRRRGVGGRASRSRGRNATACSWRFCSRNAWPSREGLGHDHRRGSPISAAWSSLARLLSPTIRWPLPRRNRAHVHGRRDCEAGDVDRRDGVKLLFGRRRLGDDAPLRHRAALADLRRGGHHRRGKRALDAATVVTSL